MVVKGDEKIKWLNQIFSNDCPIDCVNIEELGLHIDLKNEPAANCRFHKIIDDLTECNCAFANAVNMKQTWNKFKSM